MIFDPANTDFPQPSLPKISLKKTMFIENKYKLSPVIGPLIPKSLQSF